MCVKKLLLPIVAILVIGTVFSATVNNVNESCLRFPVNDAKIYNSISNVWNFDPRSGNLTVDLSGVLDLETCSEQNDKKKLLRVDLVSIGLFFNFRWKICWITWFEINIFFNIDF